MTIRITCTKAASSCTLRIEGRLLQENLGSLRAEYGRHSGRVHLDLSDLQFADHVSVEFLRELIREGAGLAGVSPYLELLLCPKPPESGGAPPPSRNNGRSKS